MKLIATYREPCNCGAMVRHNNGGSYHQILRIYKDKKGGLWMTWDSSSQFIDESQPFPWDAATIQQAQQWGQD